jgi:hypothetical protein
MLFELKFFKKQQSIFVFIAVYLQTKQSKAQLLLVFSANSKGETLT